MIRLYFLLVLCAVALTCCFNPDSYVNIDPNRVILMISKDTSLLADGVTAAQIKVSISGQADISLRSVTFKTSLGKFAGGKGDSIVVTANSSFIATARLTSTDAGTAKISAKIKSITASKKVTVSFLNAFPEMVQVAVDSFELITGFQNKLSLNSNLLRSNGGIASSGQKVFFSVTDSTGTPIGYFLNGENTAISDSNGKASIWFSAGNTTASGFINIMATAKNEMNYSITGVTTVYLKK